MVELLQLLIPSTLIITIIHLELGADMSFKKLDSKEIAKDLEEVFKKYDPKDHSDLAATLFCTLGVGIRNICGDEGLDRCLDEIDYYTDVEVPSKETMN